MKTIILVLICAASTPCDEKHAVDTIRVHCDSVLPMNCGMQAQSVLAAAQLVAKTDTVVMMQALAGAHQ